MSGWGFNRVSSPERRLNGVYNVKFEDADYNLRVYTRNVQIHLARFWRVHEALMRTLGEKP